MRKNVVHWLVKSPLVIPGAIVCVAAHGLNPGLGLLFFLGAIIALVATSTAIHPVRPGIVFTLVGIIAGGMVYWGLAWWWVMNPIIR